MSIRTRGAAIAIAIVGALGTGTAGALEPPDHEVWRASMEALAGARESSNSDALHDQLLIMFEQALRLSSSDARLGQTAEEYERATRRYSELVGPAATRKLLSELHGLTAVEGALQSPFGMRPAITLVSYWNNTGDFEHSLGLLHDIVGRAETTLGRNHATTELARRLEARAAAESGRRTALWRCSRASWTNRNACTAKTRASTRVP